MDSIKPEIDQDFSPFIRVYKDGSVERLMGFQVVPPCLDPTTNVQSKDVVYSQQLNLSSRLYLPQNLDSNRKVPLLVYYHGGGFVIETPFSPNYHNFCNKLASEAKIIIVSVDYRRAPEHCLPAGYDDSWSALKWVASHFRGDGPEEWINSFADLHSVFAAGDSAGANIAHNIGMRYGEERLDGINLVGMVLIHPYFWGKEPVGNEFRDVQVRSKIEKSWLFANPSSSGCDDPLLNPVADMAKFSTLGCTRALVFVAGKDFLRERGWYYYENLKKCGWGGNVEIIEHKEEGHVFHLFNLEKPNAKAMLQRIASLITS
ncbi:alpha/beta-Hydrolases superfamily protein [Euphorbia peplus]|nr:alpha/beta-Hydrolases superfamily protein [Euphorbia peplus]